MERKYIFVILLSLLVFYSCADLSKEVHKKELTQNEFNKIRALYFHKIKNDKMNDSLDLIIALKISNTINHENERLLTPKNVGYVMVFNQKHLIHIMSKFNFKSNFSDTTLYSKQLDMHIFPSKVVSENDIYKIE